MCIPSSLYDVANSKRNLEWYELLLSTHGVSSSVLDFIWVYAIHCWWLKKSQWNAHRPPRKTKNNPSQRIPNVNEITIDLVWDQFKPSYTIIISTITQVIYYIWGREAENISLAQIECKVFNIDYLNRVSSLNIIRYRDPKGN